MTPLRIIVPSRWRPDALSDCLTALYATVVEAAVVVVADEDDGPTRGVASRFGADTLVRPMGANLSRDYYAFAARARPAEFYLPFHDDALVGPAAWDAACLARLRDESGLFFGCLNRLVSDGRVFTEFPILPAQFLAHTGRLLPDESCGHAACLAVAAQARPVDLSGLAHVVHRRLPDRVRRLMAVRRSSQAHAPEPEPPGPAITLL